MGKGGGCKVPVTSSSRTSSLSLSTSRPFSRRSLVPARSLRAVAMMGRVVVLSRRRVSSKPMPRDAGVVKIHGRAIGGGFRGPFWRWRGVARYGEGGSFWPARKTTRTSSFSSSPKSTILWNCRLWFRVPVSW